MSVAWSLYRAAAPWVGRLSPLALPLLDAEERALWPERRGRGELGEADVWVHGASLGESAAVEPLLSAMRTMAPALRIHATATTRSGRSRLASFGVPATLAPLDDPAATERFFDRVRPRRLIIVETELWPHWLLAASKRSVPVAFVSARLSTHSLSGYLRLGVPLRNLITGLAAVLCQSEADADRWQALGASSGRCLATGNLKNDALPQPVDRVAALRTLDLDAARPLLVLGSLRPGELTALAPAWFALPASVRDAWQVAVVPRHPNASDQMRREGHRAGLPVERDRQEPRSTWRWDARLGVLRNYYAAADVAFVGGSLARFGGHHPLEPAAAGAAVAIGPYHETQRSSVEALVAGGALPRVANAADARACLTELLLDAALRTRRAKAALEVAGAARGATARTMAELSRLRFWPVA